MNQDMIACISNGIQHARSDSSMCANFQVADESRKWIQFGDDRLNAAYPRDKEPGALVAALGGELESWQPGKYLTVIVAGAEPVQIAQWIESYFRWVLDSGEAALTSRLSHFRRCVDPA